MGVRIYGLVPLFQRSFSFKCKWDTSMLGKEGGDSMIKIVLCHQLVSKWYKTEKIIFSYVCLKKHPAWHFGEVINKNRSQTFYKSNLTYLKSILQSKSSCSHRTVGKKQSVRNKQITIFSREVENKWLTRVITQVGKRNCEFQRKRAKAIKSLKLK